MRRVLIIGGNRFFGRHAAQAFLREGAEVTLLNRGGQADGLIGNIKRLVADRNNEGALEKALGKRSFDVVIDQVAYDAPQAEAACRIFADRTPLYIATSTMSVYGQGADRKEELFDPKTYTFDVVADTTADYGEAKRQMESVFFQKGRFRVIAPRFPIVCGIDDYTGRLLFHLKSIRQGNPIYFPNIKARMSFIDSRDAGECLKYLAGVSDFSGAINCTAPDTVTLQELMSWIEKAVGKKGVFVADPTKGEPSPYGIEMDTYSSSSLLRSLGFRTRKLTEWMPDLILNLARANR